MRALVVYESMYGNTHEIADRIGEGLRTVLGDVGVLPIEDATDDLVAAAELVVVGGPTHVHGMTSERSRTAAVDAATKDDELGLDPDAPGRACARGSTSWRSTAGRPPRSTPASTH